MVLDQHPHDLPVPRTALIGREQDTAEITALVLHGRERLVTLTGVGGSGKTRLALQVAADLRGSFPDGVWLVELAGVSGPLLVPEKVASVLGVQEVSSNAITGALIASLKPRAPLIILDNCEHVIDACAGLVDALLSACPNVKVLATSREPLQIAGEKQRRVLPLAVPTAAQLGSVEELSDSPAVQLFVERAGAAAAAFRLTAENANAVARICMLLAGIPLAIELAAARVRALTAEQVLQRLDDWFRLLSGNNRLAPTRQQTLKATLDWSYALLSEREKVAFRRLSVFPAGWSLEAAEAVCQEGGLERVDTLDLLARLVDKSLVLFEERGGMGRYRMLEPVRQYGERLLAEAGELKTVQRCVACFYVALAERAEPELHGPAQLDWLRRLEDELDGIRAVMVWSERDGEVESSLRLAGALHWYLWMQRHLREGQRWLESALARAGGASPTVRAKALMAAAMVCSFLGDYPGGLRHGQEALALYRQLRDAEGLAGTEVTLSHINLGLGDLPNARSLAQECVALARQSGLPWMLGQALVVLGEVVHQQGDTAGAVSLHEQAITLFREKGDGWSLRYAMTNLASLRQNRPGIIRATAISSVQLYWEQHDHLSLVAALEYLAERGETDRPETQVRLLSASHSLRKTLGAPPSASEMEDIQRHLDAARLKLGNVGYAAAWEEGSHMGLDEVVEEVLNEAEAKGKHGPAKPRGRAPGPSDTLTKRELEVVRLLALGHTDRQIAGELTITEGTAGIHVHHILEKLGLRSRAQVADWVLAHRLADKEPGKAA